MSSEDFEITVPDLPEDVRDALEKDVAEHDYALQRFEIEHREAHLKVVREKTASVENFWAVALLSHAAIKASCNLREDLHALSYCSNIEVKQDLKDPRPYEITFHFKENPFFSDATLTRKYPLKKGVAPAPEDGTITEQMREFDPEEHLEAVPTTIHWKSDDVDLTKKFPRQTDSEDPEDFEGDSGSFFHYFTSATDPFSIGDVLRDDLLPHVYQYFSGRGENSLFNDEDDDSDDEDELDDEGEDDGEESLDEDEERYKKKRKAQ